MPSPGIGPGSEVRLKQLPLLSLALPPTARIPAKRKPGLNPVSPSEHEPESDAGLNLFPPPRAESEAGLKVLLPISSALEPPVPQLLPELETGPRETPVMDLLALAMTPQR